MMKRKMIVGWVAFGIASILACSTVDEQRHGDQKIRDEVENLLRTQAAAWNRGDIDGFMDGYDRSEALVFTSGGRVRRGWNATLAGYKRSYRKEDMGRLTFSDLEIHSLGTDAAWALGRWSLKGLDAPAGGIFTLVFERRNGRLVIVHDHTSSDPPKGD